MEDEKNINSTQQSYFDEGHIFVLSNYEGPIATLYMLIKDAKMDITDIKLSEVTDQYLEYIKSIDNLDMDEASEYISVAATLLEIKSKHLLPQDNIENADEVDGEKLLLQRIQEYALFKEQSVELAKIENVNHFYKNPDKAANDFRIVLKEMNLDNLLNAFAVVLTRSSTNQYIETPKKIVKDRWTVAEKVKSISFVIKEKKRMKFTQLFEDDFTKEEMITIFLAVLELIKIQKINFTQESVYDEIDIFENPNYTEGESEGITDYSEDDSIKTVNNDFKTEIDSETNNITPINIDIGQIKE